MKRTVSQGVESKVITRLVGKDEEGARGRRSAVVAAGLVGRGRVLEGDGPPGVHDEQRERAHHVQRAALEAGDDEGGDAAGDEGPCGVAYVELLLGERVLDADHLHEVAEEVPAGLAGLSICARGEGTGLRDERVAGPLGEESQVSRDERTATHAARGQQIHPSSFLGLALEFERCSNLRDFTLNELALWVALSVVLDEDLLGLLDAVV